jgi:hypothetical protein
MRRMTHATAFFLATISVVQAQSPINRTLPAFPTGDRSVLAQSAEVHNGIEIEDPSAAKYVATNASQSQLPMSIPHESGRPYSQLASYLSCNDWSPNTWNNYACERAAIASRISQHVDMQCSCFDCKKSLHSNAYGPGCGECSTETCTTGCKPKRINRYRAPMSTLCSVPSDACGTACVEACATTSCATSHSNGCQSTQSQLGPEMHPASSMRPVAPMMASPPRDRFANPVINNPRSALQQQNPQSRFQATR